MNYSGNHSINLPRKKLAILTNLIAPYRVPIYLHLAKSFDTLLLHGGTEPNRHWKTETLPSLKTRKVWTLQIPIRKHTGVSGISDTAYLHLSPGLLFRLLSFRPDVVLTNEMGLRTAIALIYGKLAGAQVWVWWGGTPHSEKHANGWRRSLRRFLACHVKHWISYVPPRRSIFNPWEFPVTPFSRFRIAFLRKHFSRFPTSIALGLSVLLTLSSLRLASLPGEKD